MSICIPFNFIEVFVDYGRLMSTVMNAERMMWSTCYVVLAKKSGMVGTNKPKLDQNWKTSKPGTLTHGFTNSPEFIEAYRFKLLKGLIKLRKICLNHIIL